MTVYVKRVSFPSDTAPSNSMVYPLTVTTSPTVPRAVPVRSSRSRVIGAADGEELSSTLSQLESVTASEYEEGRPVHRRRDLDRGRKPKTLPGCLFVITDPETTLHDPETTRVATMTRSHGLYDQAGAEGYVRQAFRTRRANIVYPNHRMLNPQVAATN